MFAIIAVCGICTLLERACPSSFSAAEPFQSLYAIWGVCLMAIMATSCHLLSEGAFLFLCGRLCAALDCLLAVTAILHLWKRSTLISIFCGTVCYMVLVQLVLHNTT